METQEPNREAKPEPKTRIVFMGTPAFAAAILEGLVQAGWNVAGLVCQPDRPAGRGRKVVPPAAKLSAGSRQIPVLQPARMKDPEFLDALRGLEAELFVVAAYGKILPKEILSVPPLGCYNVHGSLLPAYRGAAPIQRAVMNGEKVTGITIFRMDEGMDTGAVLRVAPLAVDPEETAGELAERLALLAVEILPGALLDVIRGTARLVPQDDSAATYAPVLRKSDGEIPWALSAGEIRNRIRGLDPWPGAYTFWRGRRLRIWRSVDEPGGPFGLPGDVLGVSEQGVRVAAGKGILRVTSLQIEGGRRMAVEQFLRGHDMQPGDRLG